MPNNLPRVTTQHVIAALLAVIVLILLWGVATRSKPAVPPPAPVADTDPTDFARYLHEAQRVLNLMRNELALRMIPMRGSEYERAAIYANGFNGEADGIITRLEELHTEGQRTPAIISTSRAAVADLVQRAVGSEKAGEILNGTTFAAH